MKESGTEFLSGNFFESDCLHVQTQTLWFDHVTWHADAFDQTRCARRHFQGWVILHFRDWNSDFSLSAKTNQNCYKFEKNFTFGGCKFSPVIKLVPLRDVPRFYNKPIWSGPQERKQMTPVTRRKLHVFLLLAAVWRCLLPRAACWPILCLAT